MIAHSVRERIGSVPVTGHPEYRVFDVRPWNRWVCGAGSRVPVHGAALLVAHLGVSPIRFQDGSSAQRLANSAMPLAERDRVELRDWSRDRELVRCRVSPSNAIRPSEDLPPQVDVSEMYQSGAHLAVRPVSLSSRSACSAVLPTTGWYLPNGLKSALHAEGRGFEPHRLHRIYQG